MKKKIITLNVVFVVAACVSFSLSVFMNVGTSLYTLDSAKSNLLWVVFFDYLWQSIIILLIASLIVLLVLKHKKRKPSMNYIKYGYIVLVVIMLAEVTIVGVCYRHINGFIDEKLPSEYSIVLAPYRDKSLNNASNTFYYDDHEVLGNSYSYYSADIEYIGTVDTSVTYEALSTTSKKRYLQFIGQNSSFQSNVDKCEITNYGDYTTAQYSSSDGQMQQKYFAIYDNESKIIIYTILVDVDTDDTNMSETIMIGDNEIIECLITQFKN